MEIITPLIGYLAAVFLAVSLLINQTLKFRYVSALGSASFLVYGTMLHSLPIILSNSILLSINVYKIVKLYHIDEVFEFLEIRKEYEIVNRFLKFHKSDIDNYFPEFRFDNNEDRISFFVLRDLNIANIFSGKITGDGTITVEINYTIPKYRDFKVGKFIFDKERDFLLEKGVSKIIYDKIYNKQHKAFLRKIGFKTEMKDGKEYLVKEL